MREILFRGKRKDNGEWAFGYYAVIGAKSVIIKSQTEDYYAVNESVKKSYGNEVIEADPSTVCRYTGLTDKNGRKIFEGDILEEKHGVLFEERYVVLWDSEEGSWMIETKSGARYGIGSLNKNNFEVIGNIFDNPELLEVS